eukprot:365129-Chlamydomonas_euryale.AAC.9
MVAAMAGHAAAAATAPPVTAAAATASSGTATAAATASSGTATAAATASSGTATAAAAAATATATAAAAAAACTAAPVRAGAAVATAAAAALAAMAVPAGEAADAATLKAPPLLFTPGPMSQHLISQHLTSSTSHPLHTRVDVPAPDLPVVTRRHEGREALHHRHVQDVGLVARQPAARRHLVCVWIVIVERDLRRGQGGWVSGVRMGRWPGAITSAADCHRRT